MVTMRVMSSTGDVTITFFGSLSQKITSVLIWSKNTDMEQVVKRASESSEAAKK